MAFDLYKSYIPSYLSLVFKFGLYIIAIKKKLRPLANRYRTSRASIIQHGLVTLSKQVFLVKLEYK